jgi:hypothetical protein
LLELISIKLYALCNIPFVDRRDQLTLNLFLEVLASFLETLLSSLLTNVGPAALDRRHSPIVNRVDVLLGELHPNGSVDLLPINFLRDHAVDDFIAESKSLLNKLRPQVFSTDGAKRLDLLFIDYGPHHCVTVSLDEVSPQLCFDFVRFFSCLSLEGSLQIETLVNFVSRIVDQL